jgi:hypothetical protein
MTITPKFEITLERLRIATELLNESPDLSKISCITNLSFLTVVKLSDHKKRSGEWELDSNVVNLLAVTEIERNELRNSFPASKLMRLSLAENLENIKQFALNVCRKEVCISNGLLPIHSVLRMLANQVIFEQCANLVQSDEDCDIMSDAIFTNCTINNESPELNKLWQKVDKTAIVDLATYPVLVLPWKKKRSTKEMCENITETKSLNDCKDLEPHIEVILPLGITIVYLGEKHSLENGIIKRTGKLVVGGNTNQDIYDISLLYDFVKFDGENYVSIPDGKVLGKSGNFYLGCIFEIGRLIKDKAPFPFTN